MIDDPTRLTWLQERRKGIGGSDVAAILGIHPQVTPLAVYVSKVGPIEERDTRATDWGRRKEPLVLDALAEQIDEPVVRPDLGLMPVVHPEREWQRCTPDAWVGDRGIAEAKTAEGWKWREWGAEFTDEIPRQYLVQAQWNLGTTGRDYCWVPVLIGASDFRLYYVERHDRLIESLVERAGTWWHQHVLAGVPPAPTRADDNRLMANAWPSHTSLMVEAPELESVAVEVRKVRDCMNKWRRYRDQLEAVLKASIGMAAGVRAGRMLATWKKGKDGVRKLYVRNGRK